ncbi:MAG: hypothetical protein HC769_17745 [Cyanobacteria bacterium CRU_2_1]|nr:hypothetical protein [Cyanobacteria bacterium CRU_2_1]
MVAPLCGCPGLEGRPTCLPRPIAKSTKEHLLEMLIDAIQGWLEVASQQEEFEPDKQLIELSL